MPDPGFPLIAARLAARAIADPALTDDERRHLIRRLVPLAAADATALDTVLARLLLVSGSEDQGALGAVIALAARSEAATPSDASLQGQLTRFVP